MWIRKDFIMLMTRQEHWRLTPSPYRSANKEVANQILLWILPRSWLKTAKCTTYTTTQPCMIVAYQVSHQVSKERVPPPNPGDPSLPPGNPQQNWTLTLGIQLGSKQDLVLATAVLKGFPFKPELHLNLNTKLLTNKLSMLIFTSQAWKKDPVNREQRQADF